MTTIPLAKSFDESKLHFPVLFSVKYDGVPVCIKVHHTENGTLHSVSTRQGEEVPSVALLVQEFVQARFKEDSIVQLYGEHTFVGELVLRNDQFGPFKDVSGLVRAHADSSHKLSLMLFDYMFVGGGSRSLGPDVNYWTRFDYMRAEVLGKNAWPVVAVAQQVAYKPAELRELFNDLVSRAEGGVARSYDDTFYPGKRSWGYQKMLNEPTVDLEITGFEEAVGKDSAGLGMVGRLWARYNGKLVGVGPGKLSHAERRTLWEQWKNFSYRPRIAQIKYKRDDSYEALRQPTFQHWRDDKAEESYE